eukprot:767488-Hanusia_phi.AAC.1
MEACRRRILRARRLQRRRSRPCLSSSAADRSRLQTDTWTLGNICSNCGCRISRDISRSPGPTSPLLLHFLLPSPPLLLCPSSSAPPSLCRPFALPCPPSPCVEIRLCSCLGIKGDVNAIGRVHAYLEVRARPSRLVSDCIGAGDRSHQRGPRQRAARKGSGQEGFLEERSIEAGGREGSCCHCGVRLLGSRGRIATCARTRTGAMIRCKYGLAASFFLTARPACSSADLPQACCREEHSFDSLLEKERRKKKVPPLIPLPSSAHKRTDRIGRKPGSPLVQAWTSACLASCLPPSSCLLACLLLPTELRHLTCSAERRISGRIGSLCTYAVTQRSQSGQLSLPPPILSTPILISSPLPSSPLLSNPILFSPLLSSSLLFPPHFLPQRFRVMEALHQQQIETKKKSQVCPYSSPPPPLIPSSYSETPNVVRPPEVPEERETTRVKERRKVGKFNAASLPDALQKARTGKKFLQGSRTRSMTLPSPRSLPPLVPSL